MSGAVTLIDQLLQLGSVGTDYKVEAGARLPRFWRARAYGCWRTFGPSQQHGKSGKCSQWITRITGSSFMAFEADKPDKSAGVTMLRFRGSIWA